MQIKLTSTERKAIKNLGMRLGLILLITGSIIGGIIVIDPYKEIDKRRHITASIIEKQNLLQKQESPRLILIAGSNFLYGIDSDSLEKWIGMPVVNMALPYYLGSDFLLKQIAHNLKPNDVVVAGFEFMMTREGQMNEKMLTAQFYPPAEDWIAYSSWQNYVSAPWIARFLRIRKMISRMFSSFEKEPTIEDTTNELFRAGIDAHGDLISQDNNPSEATITIIPMTTALDFLPVISNLDSVAKSHPKVQFLYLFPTLSESGYQTDRRFIEQIEKELGSFSSFKCINRVSDSVYPDSLFHNSIYHVTPEGRRRHTQRVANWLKRTL